VNERDTAFEVLLSRRCARGLEGHTTHSAGRCTAVLVLALRSEARDTAGEKQCR
jgi:hypothetical protein